MSITSKVGEKDTKYWVALATFLKFGPRRFALLRAAFPDMESAFRAPVDELCAAGIPKPVAGEFAIYRQTINPDAEMEKLAKEHIGVVTRCDDNYPRLLAETYDAPALLYYRGELSANTALCLAVVGSRKYSAYGRRVVERIVGDCSAAGLSIVSGLALGIDALAHQAALSAAGGPASPSQGGPASPSQGGRTVAVLGSGVNRAAVYPAANRTLSERIVANGGLLLSEFPYGAPALRHHFPQRNRVIAGLCEGTLVIEAGEHSGALITARYALEQNREVFAVPGDIFHATAAGTNTLIKNGAIPVTDAQDIMEGFGIRDVRATVTARTTIPQTPEERRVYGSITTEPLHLNHLARLLKLDSATVNATLLTMELKGLVKHIGGGNYVLA